MKYFCIIKNIYKDSYGLSNILILFFKYLLVFLIVYFLGIFISSLVSLLKIVVITYGGQESFYSYFSKVEVPTTNDLVLARSLVSKKEDLVLTPVCQIVWYSIIPLKILYRCGHLAVPAVFTGLKQFSLGIVFKFPKFKTTQEDLNLLNLFSDLFDLNFLTYPPFYSIGDNSIYAIMIFFILFGSILMMDAVIEMESESLSEEED